MTSPILVKTTLILSGLIATGVGASLLFAPEILHASSGITPGDDVNLLNEMKAPAGLVLFSGVFSLLGVIRARLAVPALLVSALVYMSYGLSRAASMAIDGVPGQALVQITVLELAIGTLCLVALGRFRPAGAVGGHCRRRAAA